MFFLKKLLTTLILPPTGPLLLALLGLWMMRAKSQRWRNGGFVLALLSIVALLLLATPLVSRALIAPLEIHPPITTAQLKQVQAIVILGGGASRSPEYGGDTVGNPTLQRIRYGAHLARKTGLPVLVTGGAPDQTRPEGELMKEVLEKEFHLKVRWVESASLDTAENATFSVPLLKADGIKRIALVSHRRHLPRAVTLFEKEGIEVTPAPTVFTVGSQPPPLPEGLIPTDFGASRQALKEYLGRLFNLLKEQIP